jgi:hypothetical protein
VFQIRIDYRFIKDKNLRFIHQKNRSTGHMVLIYNYLWLDLTYRFTLNLFLFSNYFIVTKSQLTQCFYEDFMDLVGIKGIVSNYNIVNNGCSNK